MKDYYCGIADKPQDSKTSDFVYKFAYEFCVEGYAYRAGDAVNFAIGQGDTIVTPLQLARAYGALANGGTLYAPRVGKAIVDPHGTVIERIPPKVNGQDEAPRARHRLHRRGPQGRHPRRARWPGRWATSRSTRSRSAPRRARPRSTASSRPAWVASYTDDYVVVMMISQGGTGSGSTGDGIRKIWETLYGIEPGQLDIDPDRAAIPGTTPPKGLPTFSKDGSIMPPARSRP